MTNREYVIETDGVHSPAIESLDLALKAFDKAAAAGDFNKGMRCLEIRILDEAHHGIVRKTHRRKTKAKKAPAAPAVKK